MKSLQATCFALSDEPVHTTLPFSFIIEYIMLHSNLRWADGVGDAHKEGPCIVSIVN